MKTTALLIATAALVGLSANAWSQAASPHGCPPASAQNTGAASNQYAKTPNQPVEHSAVLPDAGQHQQSAAPTVKKDGQDVVAQTECPKEPNRIDAPKTQ